LSFSVFWGGSFRPPHLAHQRIAEALLADPLVERLCLVPTGSNPLKLKEEWLSPLAEEQILRAWLESLGPSSKLEVVWSEFSKLEPSYTWETLMSLDRGQKWALAIGSDLVAQLPNWKNVSELLERLDSVWVFPRAPMASIKPWEALPLHLASKLSWRVMNVELPELSSTEIRLNWKQKEALLPRSVVEILSRLAP
jgi:nicotinate-nucleotide adenylyltransferase